MSDEQWTEKKVDFRFARIPGLRTIQIEGIVGPTQIPPTPSPQDALAGISTPNVGRAMSRIERIIGS